MQFEWECSPTLAQKVRNRANFELHLNVAIFWARCGPHWWFRSRKLCEMRCVPWWFDGPRRVDRSRLRLHSLGNSGTKHERNRETERDLTERPVFIHHIHPFCTCIHPLLDYPQNFRLFDLSGLKWHVSPCIWIKYIVEAPIPDQDSIGNL